MDEYAAAPMRFSILDPSVQIYKIFWDIVIFEDVGDVRRCVD